MQALSEVYPGISEERFLKDIEDILIHQTRQLKLKLSQSSLQVSPIATQNLKTLLLTGYPLAYLMGFIEFYDHKYFVNENVLIPRPETEWMVDLLIKKLSGKKVVKIVDVGTGSGVILLSLLSHGIGKNGLGLDISPKAISVAEINAQRMKLTNVEYRISDRLQNTNEKYDLIVSNPPYIKKNAHSALVQKSVDQHEPALALYLTDTEYEVWFKEFFEQVKSRLNSGGLFMMEGHELEVAKQSDTLRQIGFSQVEVIKDLGGSDRYLMCSC